MEGVSQTPFLAGNGRGYARCPIEVLPAAWRTRRSFAFLESAHALDWQRVHHGKVPDHLRQF